MIRFKHLLTRGTARKPAWRHVEVPAREIRDGDIILPHYSVEEISHGPLEGQVRFRCNAETATLFYKWNETVQIMRRT